MKKQNLDREARRNLMNLHLTQFKNEHLKKLNDGSENFVNLEGKTCENS